MSHICLVVIWLSLERPLIQHGGTGVDRLGMSLYLERFGTVNFFLVTVCEGLQPESKFVRANFHQQGGVGVDFMFSFLTL